MKKDIWLKPGKQINNGAIVGGIGFVLYMAFSALGWSGIALIVAIGFGLESLYTFLSTLEWRETVSYTHLHPLPRPVCHGLLWKRRAVHGAGGQGHGSE